MGGPNYTLQKNTSLYTLRFFSKKNLGMYILRLKIYI
jgi:hypothetical protein